MRAAQLEITQPNYLSTFVNAINNKQLSHAYLLSGEAGTPILGTAFFISQSLICEHPSPLACGVCPHVYGFDGGSYADFVLLDGSEQTIKKKAVQDLSESFERTALENANKLIYVIHLVENMTPEAVNAFIKVS